MRSWLAKVDRDRALKDVIEVRTHSYPLRSEDGKCWYSRGIFDVLDIGECIPDWIGKGAAQHGGNEMPSINHVSSQKTYRIAPPIHPLSCLLL